MTGVARAAAIDCGSNTILLLVGERDPSAPAGYRVLHDDIEFARLGEGVDRTGRLAPSAVERGMAALRRYAALCREHGVERIRATGTSALRDAADRDALLVPVERETGIRIEVIDGTEEARLGFASATDELPEGQLALVLDIGGGSMQLMTGRARGGRVDASVSLDLGAVRMTERWLRDDPPSPPQLASVVGDVQAGLREKAPRVDGAFEIYGVAGTCTTLAAVHLVLAEYDPEKVHGSLLTRDDVDGLMARFLATDSAGRARMPGLHPKRADVIVAGTVVLQQVMDFYGKDAIRVADRGIRHAVLRQLLAG